MTFHLYSKLLVFSRIFLFNSSRLCKQQVGRWKKQHVIIWIYLDIGFVGVLHVGINTPILEIGVSIILGHTQMWGTLQLPPKTMVSNIFQHQKTVINFGVETNSNYLNFVVTYHLSLHANFWRFQSKFYPSNMPGKKGMPVCLYLYAFTCVEAWGTGTLDELEQRKHGPTERFTFWSTHSHCVWLLYYVSLLGCPAYCMDSFKMTILTI